MISTQLKNGKIIWWLISFIWGCFKSYFYEKKTNSIKLTSWLTINKLIYLGAYNKDNQFTWDFNLCVL